MLAYRQNGSAQGSRTASSSAVPGKRSLVEIAQRGTQTAPAIQAKPAAAKPDQPPTLESRKLASPGSDSRPPPTHAGEQAASLSPLHSSIGNTHVHSAMDVLGFDTPFDVDNPRFPTTTVPLAGEAALQALADKGDAERLLTGRGMDASEQAAAALDILVNVPDSHRGKVIDALDARAFENLLDRVAEADRERFSRLVEVSQHPERKLRLWAEAHKSNAENDIGRHKGDIGEPVPTYTEENDDGQMVEQLDREEEAAIRKTLTKEQRKNRKRHARRQATVETTKTEVDAEVKRLMAKAKEGRLKLEEVDVLRERKDLEYKVELKHNVNLKAETAPRANGESVHWDTDELKQVDLTLGRLGHAQNPNSFNALERKQTRNFMDTTGGRHQGAWIEIFDWGVSEGIDDPHCGVKREMVSDEFKQQHGGKIGMLEFVLTHEIGHDFADKHPKAYEAFQKAAGWERVKVEVLRADGISEEDLAELEKRRSNPSDKRRDIGSTTTTYSPIADSDEFWAVPLTAIPAHAQDEALPGAEGDKSWDYARVSPAEHFAETYAKAVHVPEQLHEDLVVKPSEATEKARGLHERIKRQVDKLEGGKLAENQPQLANMRSILGALKSDIVKAETAQKQRGEELALMRNNVFGTDKAVKLSLERLKAKQVSADKIEHFQEQAARASTPEQVALLEAEVSK